MTKKELMQKTKESLADEIVSLQERFNDRNNTEEKLKKFIELLVKRSPISLEEKIELCLKVYERLEIIRFKLDRGYKFEHYIRGGISSFESVTFEEGINRLLFIKS